MGNKPVKIVRKKLEFKIKGVHKTTQKERFFTVYEYEYSAALRYVIKQNKDYEFPKVYE